MFGAISRPGPGSAAQMMLGSPEGRALYDGAWRVLNEQFHLVPVGTDTAAQLQDRIALVYMEEYLPTWQGPISIQQVQGDPALDTVVSTVSPRSRRKTPAELYADEQARQKKYLIYGALAVGGIALLFFLKSRSRKSVMQSTAPAAVPTTTALAKIGVS